MQDEIRFHVLFLSLSPKTALTIHLFCSGCSCQEHTPKRKSLCWTSLIPIFLWNGPAARGKSLQGYFRGLPSRQKAGSTLVLCLKDFSRQPTFPPSLYWPNSIMWVRVSWGACKHKPGQELGSHLCHALQPLQVATQSWERLKVPVTSPFITAPKGRLVFFLQRRKNKLGRGQTDRRLACEKAKPFLVKSWYSAVYWHQRAGGQPQPKTSFK